MRNYSLDVLRTIATILVIIIHVCAPFVIKQNFSGNLFWISNILNSFSRVSVPIFVMISGSFLLNQNLNNFYSKRLQKLLIPLLFWTLFYLLYNYIPLLKANFTIHWAQVFMKILMGEPYYHLWYVYMILGLYSVTPIIKKLIDKNSVSKNKIIIILLFVIGILCQYVIYKNSLQIPFFLQFINYLGYYLLGGLLYNSKDTSSKWLFLSLYIAFSLVTAFLVYYFRDFYFYEYLTLSVIGASVSLFLVFSKTNVKQNLLSNLSTYSFGVYLVHPFILSRILKLNQNFSIFEILVLCIFVSFVITYLISKVKYLRKIM